MPDHNSGRVRLAAVTAIVVVVSLASRSALGGSDHPTASGKVQSVEQRSPVVEGAAHHDASPPLFLIPPAPWQADRQEDELKRLPRPVSSGASDPVVQRGFFSPSLAIPAPGVNFDGIGQGFAGPSGSFSVNSAPPDTAGDVGPNHYVQIVNSSFAIFNKIGNVIYGPVPINTLWSGFGGLCQTDNDGDPVVLYDPIADRWILSQFAVTGANGSGTPFLQCVAVSQTADPTGAYFRYSFAYNGFNDYPKMGVWPDAYYVTFNMFNAAGTSFLGGKICAYDRARMLSGAAATQQCFDVGTSFGGVLPADLDGARLPPSGAPNYELALGSVANTLAFWKFHVDWATPANSTLTGPTTLATAAFTEACGSSGTCIPQSGGGALDSLSDRLMFRLAYRNFGDHDSLVVNHTVTVGASTGVRWYEIRSPGAAPAIFQQGTYAPDASYRWMGSLAMDQSGNMGLGFSRSSSSIHPQIHYTGRLATDPLGVMSQGEGTIIDGAGSQGSSLTRWGDYSMIAVDPSDDCTFWFTTLYIPANGTFNWKTRIGSFKFPSCTAAAPKPVPDGSFVLGVMMQASRNGAAVDVSWDASTCSEQSYNLYYGTLGSFSALTGASCGLAPTGSANGLAIPNNSFFVVAGTLGSAVSSFGRTGAGAEENFTGWPGLCTQTIQSTSASCP